MKSKKRSSPFDTHYRPQQATHFDHKDRLQQQEKIIFCLIKDQKNNLKRNMLDKLPKQLKKIRL